jgi:hypothetical protein
MIIKWKKALQKQARQQLTIKVNTSGVWVGKACNDTAIAYFL